MILSIVIFFCNLKCYFFLKSTYLCCIFFFCRVTDSFTYLGLDTGVNEPEQQFLQTQSFWVHFIFSLPLSNCFSLETLIDPNIQISPNQKNHQWDWGASIPFLMWSLKSSPRSCEGFQCSGLTLANSALFRKIITLNDFIQLAVPHMLCRKIS